MFDVNYVDLFKGLPPSLAVVLITLIPIAELRASIPVALFVYKMPIFSALLLSITANVITAAIIIYLIGPVYNFFSGRFKLMDKIFSWVFKRTRHKFSHKYNTWGNVALMLFVAIPLPVTGAWTASVAAWLFGIPRDKALFYISLGVIISAGIVTAISLGIVKIF